MEMKWHIASVPFKKSAPHPPHPPQMIEEEFVDAIHTAFRTKTVAPIATRSTLHSRIADACSANAETAGPLIYWHTWSALKKNFSREALRISKLEELLDLFWWMQIILRTFLVCAQPVKKTWLNTERTHHRIHLPSIKRAAELHFLSCVLRPHFHLITVQPSLLVQSDASALEREQCIMLHYLRATAARYRIISTDPASLGLLERLVPDENSEYCSQHWPAIEQQCMARARARAMWRTRRARVVDVCSGLASFCLSNEILVQIVSEVCGFDLDDTFGTRYRIVAVVTLYTRAQTNQ